MSTTPPAGPKGPGGPDHHPLDPLSTPSDKKAAKMIPGGEKMMNSPFARMFARTGSPVTPKEMHAIMNGILMGVIDQVKKQDKAWKKAMKDLKKKLEGDG